MNQIELSYLWCHYGNSVAVWCYLSHVSVFVICSYRVCSYPSEIRQKHDHCGHCYNNSLAHWSIPGVSNSKSNKKEIWTYGRYLFKNLSTLVSHDLSSHLCARLSTDQHSISPENPKLHSDVKSLINDTLPKSRPARPQNGASFKNEANADEQVSIFRKVGISWSPISTSRCLILLISRMLLSQLQAQN